MKKKHYFQVEQWIPPKVVEKIKEKDGWLHLVTQVEVPLAQEGSMHLTTKTQQFYINGELTK